MTRFAAAALAGLSLTATPAIAQNPGNTVFMVSWRNITAQQGHLTWDDYVEHGILRAIDVALDNGCGPS